jgi:ABC-type amino acid transport substrate-binding protein
MARSLRLLKFAAAAAAFCLAPAHSQTPKPAEAAKAEAPPAAPVPPTLQRIRDTGTVLVAHRTDALPFAYLGPDKRPIGFGVDFCLLLVDALKRELKRDLKVVWVPVDARTRFSAIKEGKADLECGNTVNNPERRKDTGYSMPYFFTGPKILTKVDSGIKDLIDLRGKRLALVVGTNSVPIIKKHIESNFLVGARMIEVKSYPEAFRMVETGEADAFITIEPLLYGQRATAKDPSRYHVVGGYLILEAVAILLRKEDVEFKRFVDRQIASLMLDGTYAKLYRKWFQSPIPPDNVALDMPMSTVLRDQLRWPIDRTGDENPVK